MNYTVKEMPCKSGENNIFGIAYIPEAQAEKVPFVILSHGYNSSYAHLTDLAEELAHNGIAAYCYDFCGGSSLLKSGGISTDMSIKTEQNDLKNVIRMIKKCDFADSSKIYLYGESQGGFVSALTAAELREDIAGMVLLYPAFCIPDNRLCKNPDEMKEPFDFMGMKLSRTYRDVAPDYDIYSFIGAFDKPVLIFYGSSDKLVDVSYSQKAHAAFPNSVLEIFPNEGHVFFPEARKAMCSKAVDFFKKIS